MNYLYTVTALSMMLFISLQGMHSIGTFKEEMYTEIRTKKLYNARNSHNSKQYDISIQWRHLAETVKKAEEKKVIEQK